MIHKTVGFRAALNAVDQRKKITCTMENCEPVIYEVIDEELMVNGKRYDFRDFCFSPSQILFGIWRVWK